jgi:hypothetical protein
MIIDLTDELQLDIAFWSRRDSFDFPPCGSLGVPELLTSSDTSCSFKYGPQSSRCAVWYTMIMVYT